MFYCTCGNEVNKKDLEYVIQKGDNENDMYADDFDIEVYRCTKCNSKIYV
ncbi:MAG: hypothetical protein ACRCXT_22055 [Paraclostridium sp.]